MEQAMKQIKNTLAQLTGSDLLAFRVAVQLFLPFSAPSLYDWLVHAATWECDRRLGDGYALCEPHGPDAPDEIFQSAAGLAHLKAVFLQRSNFDELEAAPTMAVLDATLAL